MKGILPMARLSHCLLCLFCCVALATSAAPSPSGRQKKSADAIAQLLNSRSAGSPRSYAKAAAEVAKDAEAGYPLQCYIIAIVSAAPDAPLAARINDDVRARYLKIGRSKIRALAEKKNNALAWYLLALDFGNTNFLYRAAGLGNVQALNAVGSLVVAETMKNIDESECATNSSVKSAFLSFKRAAGMGDANGLYNLGMCYARGLGVVRDDKKAFECFRSAAEQGHSEAINNIGWFYREGRVVEKDLFRATKWFAKSAAYGNAFGEFNYALALQRGEGTKVDEAAAAELFASSAQQGNIDALNAYGVALLRGRGVKQNAFYAVRCFQSAAAAGCIPAMDNLATCYENGSGVEKSSRMGMEWKVRARAAAGDLAARAWLRQNGVDE